MLTTGPTTEYMFLIYLMAPKTVVQLPGKDFIADFFNVLQRSVFHLWLGVWPEKDHRGHAFPEGSFDATRVGQPLAEGLFGVLWCFRGDLDYMHKSFFPQWNQSSPCGLCRANTTDVPWTDARPEARWLGTIFGNENWNNEHAR